MGCFGPISNEPENLRTKLEMALGQRDKLATDLREAISIIRHLIDDKDTTYSVRVMRARDFLAHVGGTPK